MSKKMQVTLIDYMGSDESVINAARVSFDKSAKDYTEPQNHSLIYFLARGKPNNEYENDLNKLQEAMNESEAKEFYNKLTHENKHWTPFAHTAITLRITAPIPVRVHCFKHKQGFVENEQSRRYIDSKPDIFFPTWFSQPENVKQGSGEALKDTKQVDADLAYIEAIETSVRAYEKLLELGVSREQARFVLPQGVMTSWYWTGSLYAYANFYLQRTDKHAQKETQQLAQMVGDEISKLFPVSWKALTGE